jgi:uncharacterized protein (TIGR02453 family)
MMVGMPARAPASTTFDGFSDDAFEFYEGLVADNTKAYWTEHKHVYEQHVRTPMQALLDSLALTFDATPAMFRPYRDVRFSADKSPYKTAQGGFLELTHGVGYWMQLDAEGISVGGGFHTHDKAQTQRFRHAVDDETTGRRLANVVGKLVKQGYAIGGDAVRTRPRGVPADHPRLDLMRHESLTVWRRIEPTARLSPDFASTLTTHWRSIKPLVMWLGENARPAADHG